jgi:ketosteroid isomerase-like protein
MQNLMVIRRCTLAALAALAWSPLMAQGEKPPASRVVEIRSYNLKPGTRDRFHQLFLREALPMLQRWKVDVVAYGASLHDRDSYYLMRAYPSVDERQRSEDAFYGSDEWTKGPREAILAGIDSYATTVIRVDDATLRGLRMTERTDANDLTTLAELNLAYVRSVQTSDVRRFREILAEDFLCSNPDGSLVNRDQFLEQTARPVTISNLAAADVNVRILGDVAIIHARTTYTDAEGHPRSGRYTDVWARRNGRWLAVSAHVTRG